MYKPILVHIDETARSAELAARLARPSDAHLVGAAMSGWQSCLPAVGEYQARFGVRPPTWPIPLWMPHEGRCRMRPRRSLP